MSNNFEDLLRDLKLLKEAEQEAQRIVEEAEHKAEGIIQEADDNAAIQISEEEGRMRENGEKMKGDFEKETDEEITKIEAEYVEYRKEIKEKSGKRMDGAVSYIVDEVLKTSSK